MTVSTEPVPDQPNYVIPPPLSAVANVQLGASTAPETAMAAAGNTMNTTTILKLAAQPASLTQLAPSQVIGRRSVALEGLSVIEQSEPVVTGGVPAPAQAPAAAPGAQQVPSTKTPETQPPPAPKGPEGQQQPAPSADAPAPKSAPQGEQGSTPEAMNVRTLPLPLFGEPSDAGSEMTDAGVLTRYRVDAVWDADENLAASDTSRSISNVVSLTAVAVGGYQLALHDAGRVTRGWALRRTGTERPGKRKTSDLRLT